MWSKDSKLSLIDFTKNIFWGVRQWLRSIAYIIIYLGLCYDLADAKHQVGTEEFQYSNYQSATDNNIAAMDNFNNRIYELVCIYLTLWGW